MLRIWEGGREEREEQMSDAASRKRKLNDLCNSRLTSPPKEASVISRKPGGILDTIGMGLCSNGSKEHLSPPWKEGDFCNSIHVLVRLEWRVDKPDGDRGLRLLSSTRLLKTHDKSSGIISRDLVQRDARSPLLLPCEPPASWIESNTCAERGKADKKRTTWQWQGAGKFPSLPTVAHGTDLALEQRG